MKSITYEEFLKFKPCWLKTEGGSARLKKIGARKERWTALDILALDDVSAEDKLWAVLREELIDARILHEFACWCAEDALSHAEKPDERSVTAIKVKRAWLRGEASDEELAAARYAARGAARYAAVDATVDAAWAAAWAAAWTAAEVVAREQQVEHLKGMLMEEDKCC